MQQYGQALSLQGMLDQVALQKQAQQQGALQQQIGQQTLAQQTIQTQQAQQYQQANQDLENAMRANGGNFEDALSTLQKNGADPAYIQKAQQQRLDMVTKLQTYDTNQLKLQQGYTDAIGATASQLKSMDPDARAAAWPQLRNELILKGVPSGMIPATLPDDTMLQGAIAASKSASDLYKEALANKASNAALPGIQQAQQINLQRGANQLIAMTNGDASYQSVLNNLKMQGVDPQFIAGLPKHWSPELVQSARMNSMAPADLAKVPLANQEASQWLQANPGKSLSDYQTWAAGVHANATQQAELALLRNLGGASGAAPGTSGTQGASALTSAQQEGMKVGMSPAALDQAANLYRQGQNVQVRGRGAIGTAQMEAIQNRAAELSPTADIAANKANYAANAESLKNLQKNYDQVTAFENTAGANLNQFLTVAKAAVDSGSPWINTPLRLVNQQMVGSTNMAAFNAARQTALTEIAKVMNSSNASGVLSDSARQEVEKLIGPDATLAQIYSAANILKKDMDNRQRAYQQQIDQIHGRLGGSAPAAATQGIPAQAGNRVRVTSPEGKTGTIPRSQLAAAQKAGYKLAQ